MIRPLPSRPIVNLLLVLPPLPTASLVNAMRNTQVSLEQVLPHKASFMERRAQPARERLQALVARLVPLALVLPQELHPAT